jgi:hypothetical protein
MSRRKSPGYVTGLAAANVVQFPRHPVRYIVVQEVSANSWEARLNDKGGELIWRTEVGAKWLVLQAVQKPENRCGLPIVVKRRFWSPRRKHVA